MSDKVYYIDYTENGYNEQGYSACLEDFGYKYAGNFDDDTS